MSNLSKGFPLAVALFLTSRLAFSVVSASSNFTPPEPLTTNACIRRLLSSPEFAEEAVTARIGAKYSGPSDKLQVAVAETMRIFELLANAEEGGNRFSDLATLSDLAASDIPTAQRAQRLFQAPGHREDWQIQTSWRFGPSYETKEVDSSAGTADPLRRVIRLNLANSDIDPHSVLVHEISDADGRSRMFGRYGLSGSCGYPWDLSVRPYFSKFVSNIIRTYPELRELASQSEIYRQTHSHQHLHLMAAWLGMESGWGNAESRIAEWLEWQISTALLERRSYREMIRFYQENSDKHPHIRRVWWRKWIGVDEVIVDDKIVNWVAHYRSLDPVITRFVLSKVTDFPPLFYDDTKVFNDR